MLPSTLIPPSRIRIPFLIDLIIVTDPEHIRTISTSGDVDRLHAFPSASLPWWIRFFFRATKFYDDKRDLWFCPFESASNPTYESRRNYLAAKVNEGYTQADVAHIADLLKRNADDDTLAHAMVQVVNRRFLGEEIPPPITKDAKYTLQEFRDAIFPWKYRRAVKSREAILSFCEKRLDPSINVIDVGHNIGEVVQAEIGALRSLYANIDMPVEQLLTTVDAPTPQVPRIAIKASQFYGLLKRPTVPGKTVLIFKIAEAAAQTRNIDFTFGTGGPERLCVFKDFFIQFMTDLQQELRKAA